MRVKVRMQIPKEELMYYYLPENDNRTSQYWSKPENNPLLSDEETDPESREYWMRPENNPLLS